MIEHIPNRLTYNTLAELCAARNPGKHNGGRIQGIHQYAAHAHDATECKVYTCAVIRDVGVMLSAHMKPDITLAECSEVLGIQHGIAGNGVSHACKILLFPFTDFQLMEAWNQCERIAEETTDATRRWARMAEAAVQRHAELTKSTDEELCTQIQDLLSDLMHLCDRTGLDFAGLYEDAIEHYLIESGQKEDT